MKKLLLLILLFTAYVTVNGQTIKMKIASVTPADGEIVLALQTSDTVATSSGGGGGSGSGIPRLDFVRIKKLYGPSTNELFKRSLNGTTLAQADFEYYDAGNTLFYKIVIRDITLSHFAYLSPECSNCSTLSHQVWFDYVRIEVTDVASGNVLRYNRATRTFY